MLVTPLFIGCSTLRRLTHSEQAQHQQARTIVRALEGQDKGIAPSIVVVVLVVNLVLIIDQAVQIGEVTRLTRVTCIGIMLAYFMDVTPTAGGSFMVNFALDMNASVLGIGFC